MFPESEVKYGILVNKFSGSMPRKTGNDEVFRRRSFYGASVPYEKGAQKASKILPTLGGEFWFSSTFRAWHMPESFLRK